jgi:beta-mannosidase
MGAEELIEGWSFTEIKGGQGTKDGEWLSVDRVPTTVHVELLKAGRIPDPVSCDSYGVRSLRSTS